MQESNRREFLKTSSLAAGATLLPWTAAARAAGAGERIVLGTIGCGGRGTTVSKLFSGFDDAVVSTVCDPDEARAKKTARAIADIKGKAPRPVSDLRRLLEDPSIDAVIIATPDHWHAPAALLACQAGKHVYVEKPCAHNIREGRLLVEAARDHRRVVQIGTQGRNTDHIVKAMELLHGGAIGEVLVAKAWNSQKRGDIGRVRPSDAPSGFDYDLWLGPAPHVPYQTNRHHYTWHWWYDFGTGGMGNDGIHEVDMARWGLGVDEHPSQVSAVGGKLFFRDDQQFPDTQYVTFHYPTGGKHNLGKQLVYEQRLWSPYVQDGHENGNAFYGTEGMLILGRKHGWKLFGARNRLKDSMDSVKWFGKDHCRNFLDAIQGRRASRADILTGHLSTSLVHLGNIAVRTGGSFKFDPKKERVVDQEAAAKLLRRSYREGHWAVPDGV